MAAAVGVEEVSLIMESSMKIEYRKSSYILARKNEDFEPLSMGQNVFIFYIDIMEKDVP
jgi:hypothetical protein